jgi:hypothetical protein
MQIAFMFDIIWNAVIQWRSQGGLCSKKFLTRTKYMQQFYVFIRTTFFLLLVDCREAPSACVNCNKQTVVIESVRPTISWQQRNKFYVLSERNLAAPWLQCFACQMCRCKCMSVLMRSVVPRPSGSAS